MPRRSTSAGKTTIKIPTPIYERLSVLIEGGGYNSVTDFVVYVLRDLVGQCQNGEQLSQEQLAETRKRLKNLGYL